MPLQQQQKTQSGIDYEPQNLHICDQLTRAWACVGRLIAHGFVVLSVTVEGRRPVVWVQTSSHCAALNHGMAVRRTTARGVEQTMAADVDGCQVQWLVIGH